MADQLFNKAIIQKVRDCLISRQETIAVAESVTSGLLQFALSEAEDAAEFYQGGITAYNLGQKSRHLLVEPIHAMAVNSVSEKIAGELALNVCSLFTSDWGIGITGYASPVPESQNKLFAWYAIAWRGSVVVSKKISPKKADPLRVRRLYVSDVLKHLAGCFKTN
jgi:PncC family amidohydrolase